MQGVFPITVIQHIEEEEEEDTGLDFWDAAGTFWDHRKSLFSSLVGWGTHNLWKPALDGLRNAGTVGTFARYATHQVQEKKSLGGRRRGGGFDSRKEHSDGTIPATEAQELEELCVACRCALPAVLGLLTNLLIRYNADSVESRAFRLDWSRVSGKPKVRALIHKACGSDEAFREVEFTGLAGSYTAACRLPPCVLACVRPVLRSYSQVLHAHLRCVRLLLHRRDW